jgi:hypothetical protein
MAACPAILNETVAQNGIPFTDTDVDNNSNVDNGQPVTVTGDGKKQQQPAL